jgi:hypothetical protein
MVWNFDTQFLQWSLLRRSTTWECTWCPVFQRLSLPPSMGLMWCLMQLHIILIFTDCLLLSHPQTVRKQWAKSGGIGAGRDGTQVMTTLHPLFSEQSMLWLLRTDSVGVSTVQSCVSRHVNLWWWRESERLKHFMLSLFTKLILRRHHTITY